MMDKQQAELRFLESCRISLAAEFEIAPDDIDIHALIEIVKRSIRKACSMPDRAEFVVEAFTKREKAALYDGIGPKIVDKVFQEEAPFYDWYEKFEDEYAAEWLRKNREGF